LIEQLFKSFCKSKVIIIFENTNAKIYRTMGISKKLAGSKSVIDKKVKRTLSPQGKNAVSSTPDSGGPIKSKVI
jgi:hypothetical protein